MTKLKIGDKVIVNERCRRPSLIGSIGYIILVESVETCYVEINNYEKLWMFQSSLNKIIKLKCPNYLKTIL